MGSTFTTPKEVVLAEELHIFKNSDDVEHSIPEIPEKRKQTDGLFLIILLSLLLLWLPFLAYTLYYSDIKRISHGFDYCGNVCGEENSYAEGISCSGKNMALKPFLLYDNIIKDRKPKVFNILIKKTFITRKCVAKCEAPHFWNVLNRCFIEYNKTDGLITKNEEGLLTLKEILSDLYKSTGHIIGMVFIALGFCFIFLLLFRFCLGFVIWFTIGCTVLLCIVMSWFTWSVYSESIQGSVIVPLFFTILTIVIIVVIVIAYKKIELVVKIFALTTRALFDIPSIMLVPLVAFIILFIWLSLFIWLYIYFLTSGKLVLTGIESYSYIPNGCMVFTIFYTIIMFGYLAAFVHGCQQMTVAGAVSIWYFARDKNILGSPVLDSFGNLRKFHLGSVAFGSLVIMIMRIIRFIFHSLAKNSKLKSLIDCCIDCIDGFIHYMSNQAYIMVAMHGQPFFTSGKRANRLLIHNALNTLAVNTIGDFMLFLAKVMVVLLTVIGGILLDDGNLKYYVFAVTIGALIAAILADSIFNNFEICVDTIFLCYCEDSHINNGLERPYFASSDLIDAVNKANEMIDTQKLYSEPPPQSYV